MQRILLCGIAISFLASPAVAAEEFGHFTSELHGHFVTTPGEALFELDQPFEFLDPNGLAWNVPEKETTDGASIPPAFWWVVGHPLQGPYLFAAVVHDHYCKTKERKDSDTHEDFYYGMRAAGVEDWKATLMYWAVATFGPHWTLEQKVETQQDCHVAADGTLVCNVVPITKTVAVAEPDIDLSDPAVNAAAQAKFAAVAKTLKTTDGKTLDVGAAGIVDATNFESVKSNAASYRQLFLSKTFKADPALLGVLSSFDAKSLDSLAVWPNSQLPSYTDKQMVLELQPSHVDEGFVLQGNQFPQLTEMINSEMLQKQLAGGAVN